MPNESFRKIMLTVAAVSIAAASARAGESDERVETKIVDPIITEEVLPDEPGEVTLRLGTDYRARSGIATGALPYTEACIGIIDRLGVTVSAPMTYQKQGPGASYGFGDVTAYVKYLAVKPSPTLPAVVFGLEIQFPTGDRRLGLGLGSYELTPYVALLKDFGIVQLQGDIGWSKGVTGRGGAACSYNWAASVPVSQRKLYLLAELNGDLGWPHDASIAPAIKYFFTEKFAAGVAAPIGLNRNTDAWGVVTQFEYEF